MDFKILTIDGEKPQYKVAGEIAGEEYIVGIFTDKQIASRIMWLCEIITSDWCYSRKKFESEYIKRKIDEAIKVGAKEDYAKSVALNLYDWLDNNCVSEYAGEDSEGLRYNRIVKKG